MRPSDGRVAVKTSSKLSWHYQEWKKTG